MGDVFQTVADVDATPDEAAPLAGQVVAWLVAEGIVLGERTRCLLGADDLGYRLGPRCARAADDADVPYPGGRCFADRLCPRAAKGALPALSAGKAPFTAPGCCERA